MQIFRDYTTFELLLNQPCEVEGCTLYPIKVKDYNKFLKIANFLMISEKQLGCDKDSLLNNLIIAFIAEKNNGNLDLLSPNTLTIMDEVMKEFCDLFSMVTRSEIIQGRNNGFTFESEGNVINAKNYSAIRNTIMKMNLIKEPKVFEDKLYEQWYYKALKANRKSNLTFEDMIITVAQDMKMTFEEISEMSVFQLNVYYYRIMHRSNFEVITLFKTVDTSGKLPNVNFVDNVIEGLYKDDDSDLFSSLGAIGSKF